MLRTIRLTLAIVFFALITLLFLDFSGTLHGYFGGFIHHLIIHSIKRTLKYFNRVRYVTNISNLCRCARNSFNASE